MNYLGADADYYLPSRFKGGYGLSKQAIDAAAERETGLIVTVDTGIAAFEEIKYAAMLEIDVVVTDHHTCAERLPSCCAVVNPMRKDSEFPTRQLSGAGVAFKLVEAISQTVGIDEYIDYLPVAAIGTIGDSMPLLGENRIIAAVGMNMLQDSVFAGVRTTAHLAAGRDGHISARGIAFGIVPRINAAGRMESAECALKLFLAESDEEAAECLGRLDELNGLRRKVESEITVLACTEEHLLTGPESPVIAVMGDDWNHGVTGIVASRLTERYGKPAVVFSGKEPDENGRMITRASARSVEGINIYKLLSGASDMMLKFGGHEMAAGFTVYTEDVEDTVRKICGCAVQLASGAPKVKSIYADCYLPQELINLENAELLLKLEPFGNGNMPPVFVTDGFLYARANAVGDGKKHLKFRFGGERLDGGVVSGIAFGSSVYNKMVNSVNSCACVYTLETNEWQGKKSVSLNVIDVIDGEDFVAKTAEMVYTKKVYYFCRTAEKAFGFTRGELAMFYKALRRYGAGFVFDSLYDIKAELKNHGLDLSWFKIRYGLDIFTEFGFIKKESKGVYFFCGNDGEAAGAGRRKSLSDSGLFNELKRGDIGE